MSDQGERPLGGGTFGNFQYTDLESTGSKQVKWVPKGSPNSLPVTPEPVAAQGTGTWTNSPSNPNQVDQMNEVDVYTSDTGANGTWTKYHCTWTGGPWNTIMFEETSTSQSCQGGNDGPPWTNATITTETGQTPPPAAP